MNRDSKLERGDRTYRRTIDISLLWSENSSPFSGRSCPLYQIRCWGGSEQKVVLLAELLGE